MSTLGAVLLADGLDGVEVDGAVVVAELVEDEVVGDGVEPLAGDVDGRAVGEVAAFGEVDGGEGVAGIKEGQLGRRGWRSRPSGAGRWRICS